jgi:hypothetical protein
MNAAVALLASNTSLVTPLLLPLPELCCTAVSLSMQSIATTTKRLEIISTLTSAFRAILAATPGDLLPAVYLCTNRVAPAHAGIELGVGDAILIKVCFCIALL